MIELFRDVERGGKGLRGGVVARGGSDALKMQFVSIAATRPGKGKLTIGPS